MRVPGKAKDQLAIDHNHVAVLPLGIELGRSDLQVGVRGANALQVGVPVLHRRGPPGLAGVYATLMAGILHYRSFLM